MKNDNIIEILKSLKTLPFEEMWNKICEYSVGDLENMAVEIYNKEQEYAGFSDILEALMDKRCQKLNNDFEWTVENRQIFLHINKTIIHTFEMAYQEAFSTAKNLQDRIKSNDPFVSDYEIEITIEPYFDEEVYESNGIANVLSEPLSGFHPIRYHIFHCHYESEIKELPVFLDRTTNWNIQHLSEIFPDDYICYGMYILLHTHTWSLKDILNIKRIWADVKAAHQYHIESI